MAPTLPEKFDAPPHKMLGLRGEPNPKWLGTTEDRRDLGRAIEQAINAAHLTKKEVSYLVGYGEDQSSISKWCSGTESPQWWRLWSVVPLRKHLIVELARLVGCIGIRTVLEIAS